MKIATGTQMKEIDRKAIADFGIPGIVLMENAAIRAVEIIAADMKELSDKRCVILCGKGNNGGDGFAVARHLYLLGASVHIASFHGEQAFTGDAKINFEVAKNLNIPFICDMEQLSTVLAQCDFVVDALYGIGFHGALRQNDQQVAARVNCAEKYVYAIDIPSGLNVDIGAVEGEPIRADKTITFTAYKPAHFLYPAADYCGEIELRPIGIPPSVLEEETIAWETIEHGMVAQRIPVRRKNSHKGDYGKVFVVAGSRGMSGAAYLAATSAARSGAGLVTVGTPAGIHSVLEEKTTEVMTLALPEDDGRLSLQAAEEVISRSDRADCLLFGPGLSRSTQIEGILERVMAECAVPLIVDADGINALAGHGEMLEKRRCPVILTPHSVEMARLANISAGEVEDDRMGVARAYALRYGVTVILKGAHTLVVTPEGKGYVNVRTGNPGMATGGSGDVLAGIISALVAAGMSSEDAAMCAVYIHGLAGDMAAQRKGMAGLLAGDIMENLPAAFCAITGELTK